MYILPHIWALGSYSFSEEPKKTLINNERHYNTTTFEYILITYWAALWCALLFELELELNSLRQPSHLTVSV